MLGHHSVIFILLLHLCKDCNQEITIKMKQKLILNIQDQQKDASLNLITFSQYILSLLTLSHLMKGCCSTLGKDHH